LRRKAHLRSTGRAKSNAEVYFHLLIFFPSWMSLSIYTHISAALGLLQFTSSGYPSKQMSLCGLGNDCTTAITNVSKANLVWLKMKEIPKLLDTGGELKTISCVSSQLISSHSSRHLIVLHSHTSMHRLEQSNLCFSFRPMPQRHMFAFLSNPKQINEGLLR